MWSKLWEARLHGERDHCNLEQKPSCWTVRREWRFETVLRAERVLSAVPFNTKRQLLCGEVCYCMAQEARSASLTLNSSGWPDCLHTVMKADTHGCHSPADNTRIVRVESLHHFFFSFFFVLLAVLWLKAINNRTVPAQVVKCGECLICLSNNTAVSHHSGKMFLLRVTVKYLLGRRISSHQREAVLLVAWNAMDVKSCGPVSPKKCVYVCMYTCVCPKSGWVGKGWSPGVAVATASVM